MVDFKGQVAIVTGAGRGLGRLYALEIARRGGSVVVNDLGSTMHGQGSDSRVADQDVVFLASRACELTHRSDSAGAGRYARVFVGLAEGWLDEVSATEPFTVPASIFDEVTGLCARLGITG